MQSTFDKSLDLSLEAQFTLTQTYTTQLKTCYDLYAEEKRFAYQTQNTATQRMVEERINVTCCNVDDSLS